MEVEAASAERSPPQDWPFLYQKEPSKAPLEQKKSNENEQERKFSGARNLLLNITSQPQNTPAAGETHNNDVQVRSAVGILQKKRGLHIGSQSRTER